MTTNWQPLWNRFNHSNMIDARRLHGKLGSLAKPAKVIAAAEMDRMTPQERADVVDASIIRSWDDVSPVFRAEVEATALMLGEQRRARA